MSKTLSGFLLQSCTPGLGPGASGTWESGRFTIRVHICRPRKQWWSPQGGRGRQQAPWDGRPVFLSLGSCHRGNQLVSAPGREVRQEGERKEDRGLGKKGGAAPAEWERLDLIWQ